MEEKEDAVYFCTLDCSQIPKMILKIKLNTDSKYKYQNTDSYFFKVSSVSSILPEIHILN